MSEHHLPFLDKLSIAISQEDLSKGDSLLSGLATKFNLPLIEPKLLKTYADRPFVMLLQEGRVSIVQTGPKSPGPISACFTEGGVEHRRKYGGGKGQLIAKAVGLNKTNSIELLDTTAGMGKDSFVLATLGCKVTMLERSPIVATLLRSALLESENSEVSDITARMSLIEADSISWLSGQMEPVGDVIYLDPMFPQRDKSALVKKEMRAFKELVGADMDEERLLEAALGKARHRVVVKRPKKSAPVIGPTPTYQLAGKTTRYDVYVNKAFN